MNNRNRHHQRKMSDFSINRHREPTKNTMSGEGLMQKARELYSKAKEFSNTQQYADLINMIPSSDDTARPIYAGEHHAILELANNKNGIANYMGPGTQVIKRLIRQDPPRTESDAVAKRHDIDYELAAGLPTIEDQLTAVRKADLRMVNSLNKIEKNKLDKPRNIALGKHLINAKMLGEDLNLIDKKEFAGPLKKLTDEEKDILLTNQAQMSQMGYGKILPAQELKMKLLKKINKGKYKNMSMSKTFPDSQNYAMFGSGDIPDNLPDIGDVLKTKVLPNLVNKMGIQNAVSQSMINTVVDKTIAQSGNIQDAVINLSKSVLPIIGISKLKNVGLPPPQIASGYKKIMNNPKNKHKLLKSLSSSVYKSLKNHNKMKQKGGSWWDDFYDAFASVLKPGLSILGVVADAVGLPEIGIPLSIVSEVM